MSKLKKILQTLHFQKKSDSEADECQIDASSMRRREVAKDCKILYPSGHVYWNCDGGWDEILASLSYKIEMLHLQFYKKYRVRVQLDDVKEKFGTLRVYSSVEIDPPKWKCAIMKTLDAIAGSLETVDFKMKQVTDMPSFVVHTEEELSRVEYVKEKRNAANCANVAAVEQDGKFYRVSDIDRYSQTHREPTRFKLLFKLREWCHLRGRAWFWEIEPTRGQEIVSKFVEDTIDKWLDEVEKESESTCEKCGQRIGISEWSPRCETRGWIKNLCDRCAEKSGSEYYKNGELWCRDKMLKSKEEVEAEKEEKKQQDSAMLVQEDREEQIYQEELAAAIAEEEKEEKEKETQSNEDEK